MCVCNIQFSQLTTKLVLEDFVFKIGLGWKDFDGGCGGRFSCSTGGMASVLPSLTCFNL